MADDDRPYDAGDPKDVKSAIKSAKEWDAKRDGVIVKVMSDEAGRRWIREIIQKRPPGNTVFSSDALMMAYCEGERIMCARIGAEVMNASPQLYMTMMAEATEQNEEITNG